MNKCQELNCKKQFSIKCLEKKCKNHCQDIYCEYHKRNKVIYEPSKLPDPSLLCECKSYKTKDCINDLCIFFPNIYSKIVFLQFNS